MKIIDGLKLDGWQVEIPGCGRNDFPEFFRDMGYKVGAEIGVRKGEYSEILCKGGMKVYSIDPWQNKQRGFEQIARDRLEQYDNCTIIKKLSMDALADFEDESLDFVYIDANHNFRFVAEDIYEWPKKVKKGGVVAGHDYTTLGGPGLYDVKFIIDAYTRCMQIPKWYVLGKDREVDKYRSWFWIK